MANLVAMNIKYITKIIYYSLVKKMLTNLSQRVYLAIVAFGNRKDMQKSHVRAETAALLLTLFPPPQPPQPPLEHVPPSRSVLLLLPCFSHILPYIIALDAKTTICLLNDL